MYTIRNVSEGDNMIMKSLAKNCGTLDIHTPYTYWVNAQYFGACSYILEADETPIGYIMTIDSPEVVFVWQIGIISEHRKKGLSFLLISACMEYAAEKNKRIEVTIAEDNKDSYAAFSKASNKMEMQMTKSGRVIIQDLDDASFVEIEEKYVIEKK